MAMGHGGAASLASGRTTVKARHLGVGGGLVDEDDPRRIEVELSFEPRLARLRVHRAAGRCSAAWADFFARDLATLEEPPECADGDGGAALPQLFSQFRKRNVAPGGITADRDQLGMRSRSVANGGRRPGAWAEPDRPRAVPWPATGSRLRR